jgi:hypothetical protein
MHAPFHRIQTYAYAINHILKFPRNVVKSALCRVFRVFPSTVYQTRHTQHMSTNFCGMRSLKFQFHFEHYTINPLSCQCFSQRAESALIIKPTVPIFIHLRAKCVLLYPILIESDASSFLIVKIVR